MENKKLGPGWYFTKEEIEKFTPSRNYGIGFSTENAYRKSYCKFLTALGNNFKSQQPNVALATVYCHRFFLRKSHYDNDRYLIASACYLIAAKQNETGIKPQHIAKHSYPLRHKRDPYASSHIKQEKIHAEEKALIESAAVVVLITLNFELDIQLPYRYLVSVKKLFKNVTNECIQIARKFTDDWFLTSLSVQYKPEQLAAAALFIAAKFLKFEFITDGKEPWWRQFDLTLPKIEDISSQMLQLYHQVDPGSTSSGVTNERAVTSPNGENRQPFPDTENGTNHESKTQRKKSAEPQKSSGLALIKVSQGNERSSPTSTHSNALTNERGSHAVASTSRDNKSSFPETMKPSSNVNMEKHLEKENNTNQERKSQRKKSAEPEEVSDLARNKSFSRKGSSAHKDVLTNETGSHAMASTNRDNKSSLPDTMRPSSNETTDKHMDKKNDTNRESKSQRKSPVEPEKSSDLAQNTPSSRNRRLAHRDALKNETSSPAVLSTSSGNESSFQDTMKPSSNLNMEKHMDKKNDTNPELMTQRKGYTEPEKSSDLAENRPSSRDGCLVHRDALKNETGAQTVASTERDNKRMFPDTTKPSSNVNMEKHLDKENDNSHKSKRQRRSYAELEKPSNVPRHNSFPRNERHSLVSSHRDACAYRRGSQAVSSANGYYKRSFSDTGKPSSHVNSHESRRERKIENFAPELTHRGVLIYGEGYQALASTYRDNKRSYSETKKSLSNVNWGKDIDKRNDTNHESKRQRKSYIETSDLAFKTFSSRNERFSPMSTRRGVWSDEKGSQALASRNRDSKRYFSNSAKSSYNLNKESNMDKKNDSNYESKRGINNIAESKKSSDLAFSKHSSRNEGSPRLSTDRDYLPNERVSRASTSTNRDNKRSPSGTMELRLYLNKENNMDKASGVNYESRRQRHNGTRPNERSDLPYKRSSSRNVISSSVSSPSDAVLRRQTEKQEHTKEDNFQRRANDSSMITRTNPVTNNGVKSVH